MSAAAPLGCTVLVEPDPSGHRFQWVSHLVRANRGSETVLLTSSGATATDEFRVFLGDLDVTTLEVFDDHHPSAAAMGAEVAAIHRARPVDRFVVMDADQMLKRWWLDGPAVLRRRSGGPQAILMMTRFPPRVNLTNPRLVWLRGAKTALSIAAMARGKVQRVAYIAGRDQLRPGLLTKRVRDPALCSRHANERGALRSEYQLPDDRRIVGILGVIDERKQVPLVGEAVFASGNDADLLLAGGVAPDVQQWLDSLDAQRRARVHVRDEFLSDDDLDGYTASCDVVTIVQLNPGPSGIMGKAQAAGVPVLTAGSKVRRREIDALGSGVHTRPDVDAIAVGIRTLLDRGRDPVAAPATLPTAEEFAASVFGARGRRRE